jgi:hypothetical protein
MDEHWSQNERSHTFGQDHRIAKEHQTCFRKLAIQKPRERQMGATDHGQGTDTNDSEWFRLSKVGLVYGIVMTMLDDILRQGMLVFF